MPDSYGEYLARVGRWGAMNADTIIETIANAVASTSMTRIGAKAPRFTNSLQQTSRRGPTAAAPAYGRLGRARKLGRARPSPRRGQSDQAADDAVDGVAPGRLVEVGQQLQDQLHQGRAGQAVAGGQLHEPRVADQADEQAADREVAAEALLQGGPVGEQPGPVAALQGLQGGPGSQLARLQGVVDALAVERVDQAGGVADEQDPAVHGRVAVGPH